MNLSNTGRAVHGIFLLLLYKNKALNGVVPCGPILGCYSCGLGGGPAGRYGRIRQVNPEVVFFRPPIHSLLSFSFVISLLFFSYYKAEISAHRKLGR